MSSPSTDPRALAPLSTSAHRLRKQARRTAKHLRRKAKKALAQPADAARRHPLVACAVAAAAGALAATAVALGRRRQPGLF